MRPAPRFHVCALALACIVAFPVRADEKTYKGICDASAAIAIGKDYFVVGEDERNLLQVYRFSDAKPKASVDLREYLREPGSSKGGEADIEGAARIGSRIYWISSHGRDGDGRLQPGRMRFFATRIDESGAVPTVREPARPPFTKLLDFIASDPRFVALKDAMGSAPKSDHGLNIEGLAAAPDGSLLIGFRNPRPEGRALVLPLLNPAEVVDTGANPRFGDLLALDLGGRGIRSIEWIDGGYLIVAGAHDDRSLDPNALSFKLYRWAGPGSKAVERRDVDFGKLNPEALFAGPERGSVYVLSDDGETDVDGRKCKSAPKDKKRFRAMRFHL